jgi:hypothetical protein
LELVRILLLANRCGAAKEPHPDVLAVAGAFVHAFRKPDAIGDQSFSGHPRGLLDRKENPSAGGMRAEINRRAG